MNNTNKNQAIICTKCKTETPIAKLIMKMGGLICPNCRLVIFDARTTQFIKEFRRRGNIK